MKKFTRMLILMSIVAISPAFAQDIEDVTVTSSILGSKSQIENPIHIISEEDLNKAGTHSLGESIDNLLGVSNTDFGSIVGQPVIRGLSGARVKVLENGLVNRDVSGIGADHPIDIDLNNIQQVEIVRGPSSLLYTNGALGGIVNVVDNTIAREDFAEQEIKLGVEHNSVSDGDVHNISFSDNIEGVNLSYAYKHQNFNNFDIPDEAVIHEPGHTEEEKDHIENSDAKTRAYKGGFSIVEDWGHFGLSFKNIENVYGIPFHGEHEDPQPGQPHHDEEERIESSTDSDTINLKGTYKIAGDFINEIEYFYSDTDYFLRELHIGGKHDGEFTDFLNDAQELGAILDLSNDALTQKVVLRTMEEDTSILGEEAFMENVDSKETSIGYYLGRELSYFDIDFGVRRDEVNRKSKFKTVAKDLDFDSTSFVLGFGFDLSSSTDLSLSLGSVERAPSSVELFMDGEHAAVQRNEVGNPSLKAEEAQNIELSFNFDTGIYYGSINFYQNDVDNYIYRKDRAPGVEGTGEMKLEFADFVQQDAELDGYEIQVGTDFDFLNGNLALTAGRDSVDGTFTDGKNIPRMVPARDIYTLTYTEDNLTVDIDLTEVNAQNDFAASGDSATAGFELLDVSISRSFALEGVEDFEVVLFANNLLDEIARNHSSTVKNEVPLPGKNLGIGFRVTL